MKMVPAWRSSLQRLSRKYKPISSFTPHFRAQKKQGQNIATKFLHIWSKMSGKTVIRRHEKHKWSLDLSSKYVRRVSFAHLWWKGRNHTRASNTHSACQLFWPYQLYLFMQFVWCEFLSSSFQKRSKPPGATWPDCCHRLTCTIWIQGHEICITYWSLSPRRESRPCCQGQYTYFIKIWIHYANNDHRQRFVV